MSRLFFMFGAILAGLSVAMGAYGAHVDMFDEVQSLWIEKATRYQMYHSLALILVGLTLSQQRSFNLHAVLAGWLFLVGIMLFSGSLYLMSFISIDAGYITPLGGIAFLAGWLFLALAGPPAAKSRK